MARPAIAETTLEGLRAVGFGQRRTLDGWDQIHAFLLNDAQLGPDHAALFSEPVVDDNGRVEWYAPFDTEEPAIPLSNVPEEDRTGLLAEAKRLKDDIQERADSLCESSREEDRRLGETLSAALFVPENTEVIYAIGGRPVLVNWGTLSDVASPRLGVLDEVIRVPIQPLITRVINRVFVHRGWGWWHLLWLLFALLLAAVLAFLLWGCALSRPLGTPFLTFCPQDMARGGALAEEKRRSVELQAELERLEDQLADLLPCAPPRAEPEPEVVPPPGPASDPSEFDRRRSEAGGATGAVTVTLIWDTTSDLDLRVRCPDRTIISYQNAASCGGRLDIDANSRSDSLMSDPVENVFWPEGAVEAGTYQVAVDHYKYRDGPSSVPYQVRVKIGDDIQEFTGAISPGDGYVQIGEFTIE